MRRIIFHIGMPKCGSSTIQCFCASHTELLESKNCYYPLFSEYKPFYKNRGHISTGNGNPLVYAALSELGVIKNSGNFDLNKIVLKLINEFSEKDLETILLSHEGFINLAPKLIASMIEIFRKHDFNVEAVIYMRHQSDWLASDYQQHVKQLRSCDDIYTHVGKRLVACQYLNHCNRWALLVGKDNLTVRFLSKKTIENNLIYDFFKTLNINTDGFENLKFDNVNEGLSDYATKSLQLVNSLNISQNAYKELFIAMTKLSLKNKTFKYVLPDDLDKLVKVYFKNHNIELSEKYLSENDAKFFIENNVS